MAINSGEKKKARAAGCIRTKTTVVEALKQVSVTKKPKQTFHQAMRREEASVKQKDKVTFPETARKHRTSDVGC